MRAENACSVIMSKAFSKLKMFCVLFLGLLYSQNGFATPQEESIQDETQYFALVNETGGYLTEALHQKFWELMQTKYSAPKSKQIAQEILNALDLIKAFQIKTWESAKESYYAKQPRKVAGYDKLQEQLATLTSPYFASPAILENAEKIIEAAALRTAVDLGIGKVYITPELIEENTIGIKGGYDRLKVLLTPDWKEEYKEYVLPLLNISLLSLYAPDEYHETIAHGEEKIDMHIMQLSTQANAVYEIGSVAYQKGDKKIENFTAEEKEIYLQEFLKEQFIGYRENAPVITQGDWRGFQFFKGASALDQQSVIIMGMMVNNKALYIKYVTDTPLSLASDDFNEFTKRLQILENALSS